MKNLLKNIFLSPVSMLFYFIICVSCLIFNVCFYKERRCPTATAIVVQEVKEVEKKVYESELFNDCIDRGGEYHAYTNMDKTFKAYCEIDETIDYTSN